ncbi:MAG TPA: Crp/Fnr family transcriptional regulator [Lactobacillus sp.]|mgnify:CR=1 FL=1|nr:Crp/Fnr family transcriptional regulator [Lactobacillus sp.]
MVPHSDYPKYMAMLQTKPEFSKFTENEMQIFAQDVVFKKYAKGQALYDQGDKRDKFYFLIDGIVRTERFDEDGEFNYYEYVNKDHGFPYRGLFQDEEYSYTVRAMTKITIAVFSMSTIEILLRQNNAMMELVIQEMGQIISQNEDQLQNMVTSSASDRVRHALSILGNQLGHDTDDGQRHIDYPLTLIELAQVSATTRETASSVVSGLIDDHRISYVHKRITFLNS